MTSLAEHIRLLRGRLSPVSSVLVLSLLLSWLALQGRLVNRDGVLYLSLARLIVEDGYAEAAKFGDLTFLPLLIAGLSYVLPLSYETIAKLLDALFMAGTCALMVDMVRRRAPEAVWFAVLVVLAMPAYNQFRSDILREYGFWFFSTLGFWFAMRLMERPTWREALGVQGALMLAALFRLEALVLLVALSFWQAVAAPSGEKLRRAGMIVMLPLAAGLVMLLLIAAGIVSPPNRLMYYLAAADPLHKIEVFSAAAVRLSDEVLLNKYSREEAGFILFFGLLALIPVKFLKMTGILLIPFVYQCRKAFWPTLITWPPLAWSFGFYSLVLAGFVTHNMFLVGRYVSFLDLLAVPFIAVGLAGFCKSHPRWKIALLTLIVLTMFANVVSKSPRPTHILKAGEWLRNNVDVQTRVGFENSRIAYYAGRKIPWVDRADVPELAKSLADGQLDLVVVEVSLKDPASKELFSNKRLVELQRFTGPKEEVVIFSAPANQR